jgi:pyruvate dehydrogenase E2 component (dihydrolipoamide acetyltransferase)
MPKLGLEMEQGTVVEWYVDEGDAIEPGDVVAEIESDKAVGEVEAREGGVLRRILVPVGGTVPTGTSLGVVADPDEAIDDLLADADVDAAGATVEADADVDAAGATVDADVDAAGATVDADVDAAGATVDADVDGDEGTAVDADVDSDADFDTEPASTAEAGRSPAPSRDDEADGAVLATPRAKHLAREHGLDLGAVAGSGPGGAVVGADVERATPVSAAGTVEAAAGDVLEGDAVTSAAAGEGPPVAETRSLVGVRGAVAAAMTESARDAPQVTLHRTLVADEFLDATTSLAEHHDADLSMIDLFLCALSAALTDHPGLNGRFEDGEHRVAAVQNVGYAVATDHGLLTPVLDGTESLSLAEVAERRRALVDRVLEGDHTAEDLQGGTITVTNLGPYDVDEFTPILNPPEVAILGLGRVQDVPVKTQAGAVAFERRLPVSLTIDHRALDGADGAAFLQSLATYVEDPRRLLLADP